MKTEGVALYDCFLRIDIYLFFTFLSLSLYLNTQTFAVRCLSLGNTLC